MKGLPPSPPTNDNEALTSLRGLLGNEPTAMSLIDIKIALNGLSNDAREACDVAAQRIEEVEPPPTRDAE